MANDGDISRRSSRIGEIILFTAMFVFMAATVGIVVWQTGKLYKKRDDTKTPEPCGAEIVADWPIRVEQLAFNRNMEMTITKDGEPKLTGYLNNINLKENSGKPNYCQEHDSSNICVEWRDNRKLTINLTKYQVANTMESLDCFDITWQALSCSDQVLTDCFNVSQHHWYGGYADKFQHWPFQKNTRSSASYVVNDSYAGEIGGVIERYVFSSSGVGIIVDHDVPLYFSLNKPTDGLMCFTAKFDKYPYFKQGNHLPVLKYKICQAQNVKDIHTKMSSLFFERPDKIPDERLFKYPIWSTWAQYHKDINQSTVLEFANNILKYNFSHAQLEIDDDWTPSYGDMEFNVKKFPNATKMIEDLNKLGFRVTVWVHPFFNVESKAFKEAAEQFYLVRQFDGKVPAMTPWWDGNLAGILDVSNDAAVNWYLSKLSNLKTTYNISSFKFDAGETSWLPHIYSLTNMSLNPTEAYPMKWVELAAKADTSFHQEVRVGYKTQTFPVFIRMMDKMSNWGHDNAFKSIIPCVLTYGILGYPFVLPDMIGGNAYNNRPDPELFIRWLQLNTFLPSMQYSIVPWIYNDTIIQIAQKFTEMHEDVSEILIHYADKSTVTGEPIIRPLWWIDPEDETALTSEDEFLVGDTILVAPVMEQGARSRDIYFPSGHWQDQIHNKSRVFTGPLLVEDYKVDLNELAYFKRVYSSENITSMLYF